jgi:hypothetical protein
MAACLRHRVHNVAAVPKSGWCAEAGRADPIVTCIQVLRASHQTLYTRPSCRSICPKNLSNKRRQSHRVSLPACPHAMHASNPMLSPPIRPNTLPAELLAKLAQLRLVEVLQVHWIVDSICVRQAAVHTGTSAFCQPHFWRDGIAHFCQPVELTRATALTLNSLAISRPSTTCMLLKHWRATTDCHQTGPACSPSSGVGGPVGVQPEMSSTLSLSQASKVSSGSLPLLLVAEARVKPSGAHCAPRWPRITANSLWHANIYLSDEVLRHCAHIHIVLHAAHLCADSMKLQPQARALDPAKHGKD